MTEVIRESSDFFGFPEIRKLGFPPPLAFGFIDCGVGSKLKVGGGESIYLRP